MKTSNKSSILHRIIILSMLSVNFFLVQGQIIADHTVVDKYDDIPQHYIDEVKKMWLVVAGESHSYAYITGLRSLGLMNPKYAVSVLLESGVPESYTSSHLRASRATWGDLTHSSGWIYSYGEEDWITSTTAINRTKDGIKYCYDNNIPIAAIGFGWCWDDEVGLDVNDYFTATQEYVDYCNENDYPTTVYYTTGPIDYDTPMYLYDLHVRNEAIRDYIDNYEGNVVFFDYADILCHDDDGTLYYVMYGDIPVPKVTPTNAGDHTIGHIGENGAIRLAKALWWMLARIAGWDGGTSTFNSDVEDPFENVSITITGDEIRVLIREYYEPYQLRVYNLLGSTVPVVHFNNNVFLVNASDLKTGLHIIELKNKSKTIRRKIFFQKQF